MKILPPSMKWSFTFAGTVNVVPVNPTDLEMKTVRSSMDGISSLITLSVAVVSAVESSEVSAFFHRATEVPTPSFAATRTVWSCVS